MKQGSGDNNYPVVRMAEDGPLPDVPFIGLVNGADAPLLPLDLPKSLKGQARERVAARQISDMSGTDLDQTVLHPFTEKPHVTPWTHVIVATSGQVANWRKHFNGPSTKCLAILPDYLALPAAKDIWTINVTGETVSARLGLEDGFSCDRELAAAMLNKARMPKAVLRLGEAFAPVDDLLSALKVKVVQSVEEFAALSLPTPLQFAHKELIFDLGLDPRAAFAEMAQTLRTWRLPVILSVLALLLWTTSVLVAVRDLNSRAVQTRIDIVAEVRKSFVPTGPVLDIRAQVSQALSTRQAKAQSAARNILPLDLFKTASAVIDDMDATTQTAAFAPSSGLVVTLLLPDFATLDQVSDALESEGVAVQIEQSSSVDTGGVEAVLGLKSKEDSQ